MSASIFDENVISKVTLETESSALPDDLPFHILMLGDWGGNSEFSAKPLSTRKFIEIDRDEFDDVIRKIAPQLNLKFDDNEINSLKLIFESLDDFHPDNIFQRVSLFADLRDIRQRLCKPETFDKAAGEVRSWFSHSTVEQVQRVDNTSIESLGKPLQTDSLLDQILDQDQKSKPVIRNDSNSPLSEFIGNIIAPHLVKIDSEEQSNLLLIVDEVISDLMRKILHHQMFQQLESAWRGLYFLLRNVETNSKLKVFLFQSAKDELLENLASVSDLTDSDFYNLIAGNSPTPVSGNWSVMCGNYQFRPNIEDIAALIRIAKISETARCPFVSQISSPIFSDSNLNDLNDNDQTVKFNEESSELKLWSVFRQLPESSYIGLSFPGFIGRLPYGQQTEPTELFYFEEFQSQSDQNIYLWLNSAFAYIYALAEQFSRNKWNMKLNVPTVLPDSPLHFYEDENQVVLRVCTEFEVSETLHNRITELGCTPLLLYRNEDKIHLPFLQSVSKSSPHLKGKWQSV